MGGSYEDYKKRLDCEEVSKEVGVINICFWPCFGNSHFDSSKLIELFNKEVDEELKRYGVNYKILIPGGRGGGGGGNILKIILELWSQKEIIGLIIAIFNYIVFQLKRFINMSSDRLLIKPTMEISFTLNVEHDFDENNKRDVEVICKQSLGMTKYIGNYVCSKFNERHPFFNFDQIIKLNVKSRNCVVSYKTDKASQTKFNNSRILRIISNLKIGKYLHIYYYLNSLLIQRRDINQENSKIFDYYLLISSKLLKDYFS